MKKYKLSFVACLLSLFVPLAFAGEGYQQKSSAVNDAWLLGKIETAFVLNKHLSAFDIDTSVDNAEVTLAGTVESEIDKDLAYEIAKGTEGVTKVRNNIKIDKASQHHASNQSDNRSSFAQAIDDATTTAIVKTKLLTNSNTEGSAINVKTKNNKVELDGVVSSSKERKLAERIARNASDVEDVTNNIRIAKAKK